MGKSSIYLFLSLFVSILFLADSAVAEQDSKSIEGRLKIQPHEAYLKVDLFLTNTTDNEIVIVTGAGGVGRSVVPTFFSRSSRLVAAVWKSPPRRDMKFDLLTLKPSQELLYDTYILPRPPGEKIEGVIYFQALDNRDQEYIIRSGLQKIPATNDEMAP